MCSRTEVRTNKTAYVDRKFGNNQTAQLENANLPFRSISKALKVIQKRHPVRSINDTWTLYLNPGIYTKPFVLPNFIDVVGSGDGTIIGPLSIVSNGYNTVSSLTISGSELPMLDITLSSKDVNGTLVLRNVTISYLGLSKPITSASLIKLEQPLGFNGVVSLYNCIITANFLEQSFESLEIITLNSLTLNLFEPNIFIILNTTIPFVFAHSGPGSLFIYGGNTSISNGGNIYPQKDNIIYLADETSGINCIGNIFSYLETIVPHDVQNSNAVGNIIYTQVDNSSLIYSNSSTVSLSLSGGNDRAILANCKSLNSTINLSQLNISNISFTPRILGFTERIRYSLSSPHGSSVNSGGFYSRIVSIITIESGVYVPSPDDSTILMLTSGATVTLNNPSLNDVILYKGQILTIKNISGGSITVNAANDTLHGGTQTLLSEQSITIQNDGTKWYLI